MPNQPGPSVVVYPLEMAKPRNASPSILQTGEGGEAFPAPALASETFRKLSDMSTRGADVSSPLPD